MACVGREISTEHARCGLRPLPKVIKVTRKRESRRSEDLAPTEAVAAAQEVLAIVDRNVSFTSSPTRQLDLFMFKPLPKVRLVQRHDDTTRSSGDTMADNLPASVSNSAWHRTTQETSADVFVDVIVTR